MSKKFEQVTQIPEPPFSRLLFADTRLSFIWLLLRIYIGWEWVVAGYAKITSPMWTGAKAGVAITGFLSGAMKKTTGLHPDVSGWYGGFVHSFVIPHATFFSFVVSYGELF